MLSPTLGVQKIKTGIYELSSQGTVSLLMGRSSLTAKGIVVQTGIIYSDYKNKIQVMVQILQP